ncbi:hypothetical protein GQ607_005486, partial [Colletotrichum asianum]
LPAPVLSFAPAGSGRSIHHQPNQPYHNCSILTLFFFFSFFPRHRCCCCCCNCNCCRILVPPSLILVVILFPSANPHHPHSWSISRPPFPPTYSSSSLCAYSAPPTYPESTLSFFHKQGTLPLNRVVFLVFGWEHTLPILLLHTHLSVQLCPLHPIESASASASALFPRSINIRIQLYRPQYPQRPGFTLAHRPQSDLVFC